MWRFGFDVNNCRLKEIKEIQTLRYCELCIEVDFKAVMIASSKYLSALEILETN